MSSRLPDTVPNARQCFYTTVPSALPNTAEDLTTNLSLNTLSCLHDSLISANEDALANLSQASDKLAVLAPDNFTQLIAAQPNALRRL